MRARDVMTSPVFTVAPDTPVTEIAEMLISKRISAVPVVDDQERVIGMVSEGDLLRRSDAGTARKQQSEQVRHEACSAKHVVPPGDGIAARTAVCAAVVTFLMTD